MFCKIVVERKDRIRIFRYHRIDIPDALSVGFVEGGDKARVDRFVADPGGEDKGQAGKVFPGPGQVIDIRGDPSLFERTVADDDTCRRPFYMIAKIFSAVD